MCAATFWRVMPYLPPLPPSILYRSSEMDGLTEDVRGAAEAAGWGGAVVDSRTALPANTTGRPAKVIGRYSVLPFYTETYADLANLGYQLANTPEQHRFCADIKIWADLLSDFTPRTWTEGWDRLPEGAYVLKGATNSRKHKWNTHMFAPTKADVPAVFGRLLDDSLIAPQGIVAREYVPLMKLGDQINGAPFTHEYRLFYWGRKFVAGAFYWSSFEDADNFRAAGVPAGARAMGDKCADAMLVAAIESGADAWPQQGVWPAMFYVLDVAETASGEWILIEVNDGQMSGLSEIDPVDFYRSLWNIVGSEPAYEIAEAVAETPV